MKKTFLKPNLRLLVSGLFVLGALLFCNVQANAQVLGAEHLDWKSSTEAVQVLETTIVQLDGQLLVLTPGTPAHENVLNHMTYYKLIHGSLEDGASVAEAVANNLHSVGLSTTDDNPQTQADYTLLYEDAVALLTN